MIDSGHQGGNPVRETARPTQRVRFGSYEVDLRSGELRKNGLRLKLSGQPFQVLALLLERPGDVVTREEIQKRLWPADTFVDFDHSLNTAINKIREAVGDSADNPRFVETLPRRGYRFIASVEVGAGSPWRLPALSSAHTVPAPAGHPQGVSPERPGGVSRELPLRTRWGLRLGAMLAMLVLGAAVAWYVWEHSRANAGYIRYMGFWESVGFIHWEVNGKGWYVTAPSKSGSSLLKVDPTGKAQRLMQGSSLSDCIPSPDGRHVVVMGQAITSNVWMLENF